jgi:hypothetical protein
MAEQRTYDARALMWLSSRGWICDDETDPRRRLSTYRTDYEQGGIHALCPVTAECPHMQADPPRCHGIVYCPVWNGGWNKSHNCRRDWREDVREHRREVALAMIAEALEAREAWEADSE